MAFLNSAPSDLALRKQCVTPFPRRCHPYWRRLHAQNLGFKRKPLALPVPNSGGHIDFVDFDGTLSGHRIRDLKNIPQRETVDVPIVHRIFSAEIAKKSFKIQRINFFTPHQLSPGVKFSLVTTSPTSKSTAWLTPQRHTCTLRAAAGPVSPAKTTSRRRRSPRHNQPRHPNHQHLVDSTPLISSPKVAAADRPTPSRINITGSQPIITSTWLTRHEQIHTPIKTDPRAGKASTYTKQPYTSPHIKMSPEKQPNQKRDT